jgi:hypothetical protein
MALTGKILFNGWSFCRSDQRLFEDLASAVGQHGLAIILTFKGLTKRLARGLVRICCAGGSHALREVFLWFDPDRRRDV